VIEEAFTNSFHESVLLLDEPTVVKRKAHADTAAANKGGFGFLIMPTYITIHKIMNYRKTGCHAFCLRTIEKLWRSVDSWPYI